MRNANICFFRKGPFHIYTGLKIILCWETNYNIETNIFYAIQWICFMSYLFFLGSGHCDISKLRHFCHSKDVFLAKHTSVRDRADLCWMTGHLTSHVFMFPQRKPWHKLILLYWFLNCSASSFQSSQKHPVRIRLLVFKYSKIFI